MAGQSSSTVRVFWLDRERVLADLRETAREMAAAHPEIEEVILFGSLARGDATAASDADLLVLLRASSEPRRERIARYLPDRAPVPVDVLALTRAEYEQALAEGEPFFLRIRREGQRLFS